MGKETPQEYAARKALSQQRRAEQEAARGTREQQTRDFVRSHSLGESVPSVQVRVAAVKLIQPRDKPIFYEGLVTAIAGEVLTAPATFDGSTVWHEHRDRLPTSPGGHPSSPQFTAQVKANKGGTRLFASHIHLEGQAPPDPSEGESLSGSVTAMPEPSSGRKGRIEIGEEHPHARFWSWRQEGGIQFVHGQLRGEGVEVGRLVSFQWSRSGACGVRLHGRALEDPHDLESSTFDELVTSWSDRDIQNEGLLRRHWRPPCSSFGGVDEYCRFFKPWVLEEVRAMMQAELEGSTSPIPGRLSPSNHADGWTYLEFSTEGEQQIPEEALMGSNFVCGFEGEGRFVLALSVRNPASSSGRSIRARAVSGRIAHLVQKGGGVRVQLHLLGSAVTHSRMYEVLSTRPPALFDTFRRQLLAGGGEGLTDTKRAAGPLPGCSEAAGMLGGLNATQQNAVAPFVFRAGTPSWNLVQGPPGTGKTTMITRVIGCIVRRHRTRCLICAPSNKAMGVIAERFADTDPDIPVVVVGVSDKAPPGLQRIHASHWVKATVSTVADLQRGGKTGELQALLGRVQGRVAPFGEAIQQVLKESGKDARRLRQQLDELQRHWCSLEKQEEIEVALIATAAVIFCTLSTSGSSRFTQGHCSRHRKCAACRVGLACTALTEACRGVTHLIVDEAGQCIEPETIIPFKTFQPQQCLVVGDQNQLPATVMSQQAAEVLSRSLMQRLAEDLACACPMLDTQYRMHPEIVSWPSRRFYRGRLQTAESVLQRAAPSWMPKGFTPVTFVDCPQGREAEMNKSFCNASEVELVCGLLSLLKVRPEQVAIITFYKAQALELERALRVPRSREGGGFDRCIHTVDSFQGSEADVVLISFVRTERSGFLRDFRRLNVAVTRAKHLLLLVGNYSQLGRVTGAPDVSSLIEDLGCRSLVHRKGLGAAKAPLPRPQACTSVEQIKAEFGLLDVPAAGVVADAIAAKPADDALLAVHVVKKSPSGTAKGRWRPACVAKGTAGALDKCKEELLRPAMERNDYVILVLNGLPPEMNEPPFSTMAQAAGLLEPPEAARLVAQVHGIAGVAAVVCRHNPRKVQGKYRVTVYTEGSLQEAPATVGQHRAPSEREVATRTSPEHAARVEQQRPQGDAEAVAAARAERERLQQLETAERVRLQHEAAHAELARLRAEQQRAEQAARAEQERLQAEAVRMEQARLRAEQQRAEQAARAEQERLQAEAIRMEQARLRAEQQRAEQDARAEQERLQLARAEQERQQLEAAKVRAEQEARAELQAKVEQQRLQFEAARAEEQERHQAEAAAKARAEQQRSQAEVTRVQQAEMQAERQRLQVEAARSEQEKQRAEAARLEQEKQRAEAARLEQEKQRAEAARSEQEKQRAEAARSEQEKQRAAAAKAVQQADRSAAAARAECRVVDPARLISPQSVDFSDLICMVCGGLPFSPMQTPCEHYFCSSEGCPEGWDRKTFPACPQCRTPIAAPLSTPPKMVRSIVGGLQIRCRLNPEHVVRLDALQQHEREEQAEREAAARRQQQQEGLEQLRSMGFGEAKARRAITQAGGDLDGALAALIEEDEAEDQVERAEQAVLVPEASDHQAICQQLAAMGFDEAGAHAAAAEADGDLDRAIAILIDGNDAERAASPVGASPRHGGECDNGAAGEQHSVARVAAELGFADGDLSASIHAAIQGALDPQQSPRESPVRRSTGSEQAGPASSHPQDLSELLVSMGFEPAKARHASAEAQGDMDRALAVLVDACGDEDGAAEAPRAPAAVEAAATTSVMAGTVPMHDSQWNGEWDMLVAELMEMGFGDAVACRASLAEHEGDLKGAVEALAVRERQGGAFI